MKKLFTALFAALVVAMGTISPVFAYEYNGQDTSTMTDQELMEAQQQELAEAQSQSQTGINPTEVRNTAESMVSTSQSVTSFWPIFMVISVFGTVVGFIAHFTTISKFHTERKASKQSKDEAYEEPKHSSHNHANSQQKRQSRTTSPKNATADDVAFVMNMMQMAEENDDDSLDPFHVF